MSAVDIACYAGAGLLLSGMFVWTLTVFIEHLEDKLWPRGLRWFPGLWLDCGEALHRAVLRVFWPEKLPAFKGRAVLRLENYDAQWRTWVGISDSNLPEWRPWNGHRTDGRWEPRQVLRSPCPCGYFDECAVHCGTGHADGRCPVHDWTLPETLFTEGG